jgi:hypothetical protein
MPSSERAARREGETVFEQFDEVDLSLRAAKDVLAARGVRFESLR